jgi:D-beta-D-heptose 7-phosphate kinase/D-beta-D-heptose 1-phosphate adenosyltransferase
MKKYEVILISGGFDPIHKGHIECIQNAAKLADQVWVGINNDEWLIRKKGKPFMKALEREFIMNNIKGVDYVYVMNPLIPGDKTAMDFIDHSLKRFRKTKGYYVENSMAFGNGGDRNATNVPEESYCKSLGIDVVWGLGDKVQSSSWLLEKYLNIELQPNK